MPFSICCILFSDWLYLFPEAVKLAFICCTCAPCKSSSHPDGQTDSLYRIEKDFTWLASLNIHHQFQMRNSKQERMEESFILKKSNEAYHARHKQSSFRQHLMLPQSCLGNISIQYKSHRWIYCRKHGTSFLSFFSIKRIQWGGAMTIHMCSETVVLSL